MQFIEHRQAKATPDATNGALTAEAAGSRATSVPPVKSKPIDTSFAGSERQIRPRG
jgi:hypothetical protein